VSLDELGPRYVARNDEGVALVLAGKLAGLGQGAGCDGPIGKIARDLRVTGLGSNGVSLVDFKAGFEDSTRGVTTSLDWVIAVVDPTTAGIQVAIELARAVRQIQSGVLPATRHLGGAVMVELAERQFREARIRGVLAVLNRVPDSPSLAYLEGALADEGPPIVGVFDEEPVIQGQWLRGQRVRADGHDERAVALVRRLEAIVEELARLADDPVSRRCRGEGVAGRLQGRTHEHRLRDQEGRPDPSAAGRPRDPDVERLAPAAAAGAGGGTRDEGPR
jgi:hypothetical protein